MYKYTAGQYFGPHYDDSVRDTVTAAKSEWTLLIYLSGTEDGVEGGEVINTCLVFSATLTKNFTDVVLS
jgi:alpha-1,3-mannosyltransferase